MIALVGLPDMSRLLVIAASYAVALSAVLNLAVDALRAQGASVGQGSALFVVISVSAMIARLVWGRLADGGPGGAPRRWHTLSTIWTVLIVGALAYWAVTPLGPAAQIPVMAVFAFGVLGANGVIYLIAGELAGPDRAGQAVALASVILFGIGALSLPLLGWQADHAGYRSLWLDSAAFGALCLALTVSRHGRAPWRGPRRPPRRPPSTPSWWRRGRHRGAAPNGLAGVAPSFLPCSIAVMVSRGRTQWRGPLGPIHGPNPWARSWATTRPIGVYHGVYQGSKNRR